MKREGGHKKSQNGQLIIEAMLLMLLFVGVATLIQRQMREKNIISAMVAGPWEQISGMMSNGVWKPESKGRELHPQGNIVTREGDN